MTFISMDILPLLYVARGNASGERAFAQDVFNRDWGGPCSLEILSLAQGTLVSGLQ